MLSSVGGHTGATKMCVPITRVAWSLFFSTRCTYALGLWFGSYLISSGMKDHDYCNYSTGPEGGVIPPDEDRCITGGDVMICFFCVLFGGLNLGQAGELPLGCMFCLTSSNVTNFLLFLQALDCPQ